MTKETTKNIVLKRYWVFWFAIVSVLFFAFGKWTEFVLTCVCTFLLNDIADLKDQLESKKKLVQEHRNYIKIMQSFYDDKRGKP